MTCAYVLTGVACAIQAHELGQKGAAKVDEARAKAADKIAPN
jgi:hypothetical protein